MKTLLKKSAPWIVSAASGFLLALAFPPFNQADAAWFALIPALLLFRSQARGKSFWKGFVFGYIFWVIDLLWLVQLRNNDGPIALVLLGIFALAAWCSLFFAFFAKAVSWMWSWNKITASPWGRLVLAVICEPLLWVGAEYIRGTLFTGFAWNPLAASQYRNCALLHCISWCGAGTLSFLIVAVNSGIASMFTRIWQDVFRKNRISNSDGKPVWRRFPIRTAELMVALTSVVACWMAGISAIRSPRSSVESIRVGLMHPDIPCVFETDTDTFTNAYARLADYSDMSQALRTDLNIWPETALPGYIPYDEAAYLLTSNAVASSSAPLLSGGVEYAGRDSKGEDIIYNSAFVFGPNGVIQSVYRKRHLVPCGEYIPGYKIFPFLKNLAPTGYTCEAGKTSRPISVRLFPDADGNAKNVNIGMLICFEDVFPYLSRETTVQGANMLVCAANDAWFDGSYEAEQHLSQAVLRCVENHRPMARSTNRGVTCLISANGRVLHRIGEGNGGGTPGFFVSGVNLEPKDSMTPYTRYGDWLLNIPAAVILFAVFVMSCLKRVRVSFL